MNIENLINNMRVERDINSYFENVQYTIDTTFESEEDQEVIYTAINTVLESDNDLDTQIELIDNIIEEAAAKSCQEGRWTRPKQISFNARESTKVTWGKGVNAWFGTWESQIEKLENKEEIIEQINEALASNSSDIEKVNYINKLLA